LLEDEEELLLEELELEELLLVPAVQADKASAKTHEPDSLNMFNCLLVILNPTSAG
ncbi:MAG: hypothetical protein RL497_2589, partial [Pseudomonadota bacterium]